jgi:hypothetical protein
MDRPITVVECRRCGKYGITREAACTRLPSDKWKFSAYVREKNIQHLPMPILFSGPITVGPDTLPGSVAISSIEEVFPKTIADRLDRTLRNLAAMSEHFGAEITLTPDDWAVGFAKNSPELAFVLDQLAADGYLRPLNHPATDFNVTVKGWNRIAELERGGPLSKQVFVAMKFDSSLSDAYDNGIKPAIEADCGYSSFRVDRAEHNEDINDKIIAEMRKSKFMVADFTGHRPGVYFEAGFMMGLGRTVIFTCKEGEIGEAHFDTSHRNHVIWKDAADFREKLKLRIQATIIP